MLRFVIMHLFWRFEPKWKISEIKLPLVFHLQLSCWKWEYLKDYFDIFWTVWFKPLFTLQWISTDLESSQPTTQLKLMHNYDKKPILLMITDYGRMMAKSLILCSPNSWTMNTQWQQFNWKYPKYATIYLANMPKSANYLGYFCKSPHYISIVHVLMIIRELNIISVLLLFRELGLFSVQTC